MTPERWERFVAARRPLTPVADRVDCDRAIAVIDELTGEGVTDPMIQAYLDFTAVAVQEWESEHDDQGCEPDSLRAGGRHLSPRREGLHPDREVNSLCNGSRPKRGATVNGSGPEHVRSGG